MAQAQTLLNVIKVSKRYVSPDGTPTPYVLREVTFAVGRGETIAVTGPSGSGKSTLLNIIGGLDRPTSGAVELAGVDLTEMNERRLAQVRNGQIGFVFQAHHLLPQCTVLENVLVPTLVADRRANRAETVTRAEGLLERVGLKGRLTYRPGQLSGGECQRVAVVRALMNQPELLLADEPTGSLDRQAADTLFGLLLELNREQGVTLMVVTHAVQLAERLDKVWSLVDGDLVLAGSKS